MVGVPVQQDPNINLTDQQKNEVTRELNYLKKSLNETLRRYYRMVAVPSREGISSSDIGIPTYGEIKGPDQEVYEKLRVDGEVLESIAPLVIEQKYLSQNDFISTQQLYHASFQTPGQPRPISREVMEKGIAEGVRTGLFGLGELKEGKPVCRYFKEAPTVAFTENEVIIKESICEEQRRQKAYEYAEETSKPEVSTQVPPGAGTSDMFSGVTEETTTEDVNAKKHVHLAFRVPKGKVSSIMGVMNLLQSKFETLSVELKAENGSISEQDYENKIMETFSQLDIEPEEK